MVSIVVPARNEEGVIARLLESLKHLDYPNFEVILVDDCSSDRTSEISRSFAIQVVTGQPRPAGWNGKQWACHQGASIANGQYLVFTDADTWHRPESLREIVGFMQSNNLGMASSLPYHQGESLWEYLLGPFHVLLCLVTAPYSPPKFRRVFAVGQYLAFDRSTYTAMGGHESVKQAWVEDVPMANLAIQRGFSYGLYVSQPLHFVRMYGTFREFFAGWRRNFRAGLTETQWSAPVAVGAVFYAMTGGWQFGSNAASLALMVVTMVVFSLVQRRFGNFSVMGPVLFPVTIALFCAVSLASATDMLLRRDARWKGRSFSKISSPT